MSVFDESVVYQSLKDGSSEGKKTVTTFRNWVQWITKDITAMLFRVDDIRADVKALRKEVAELRTERGEKSGDASGTYTGTLKIERR